MKFEHDLVSEIEMSKMCSLCNNISDNFKCSIDINPQFEYEIGDLYKRTITNFAKTTINMFNLRYMKMFDNLANNNDDEDIIEFSETLLGFINSFFKKLEQNIIVNTEKDLNELRYILEISLILMDGVIEDNDIELAYESFFQIERRLKREHLYQKTIFVEEHEKFVNSITNFNKEIYNQNELILQNNVGLEEYEISNY